MLTHGINALNCSSIYWDVRKSAVFQQVLSMDPFKLGYTEEGHCNGEPHQNLPGPQRLQWEIPSEVNPFIRLKLLH